MAKKPRNPKIDYAVYLAVRCLVSLIQLLPMRIAPFIAGGMARLAYRVDKRHREVARANLNHAFPEYADDPNKVDRMVRDCYRHYALMFFEMIWAPRKISIWTQRNTIHPTRPDWTIGSLIIDRPLLMVTAHFGNWELAGYAMGAFGFKTYAIARVLDNPYLESFSKKFRQKTGQTILAKKGDFDEIQSILDQKGAIATVADQDAGERGLFVNFFNRPASTHKAVALLALEYEVTILVIGMPRVGGMFEYDIVAEEWIDPVDYARRPDGVKALTQHFTASLERMIRRHPEQYFWLHRRWKHQPVGRKKRIAA